MPHILWEFIEVGSLSRPFGIFRLVECHVGHVNQVPSHENPQQHQTLIKTIGQHDLVHACVRRDRPDEEDKGNTPQNSSPNNRGPYRTISGTTKETHYCNPTTTTLLTRPRSAFSHKLHFRKDGGGEVVKVFFSFHAQFPGYGVV